MTRIGRIVAALQHRKYVTANPSRHWLEPFCWRTPCLGETRIAYDLLVSDDLAAAKARGAEPAPVLLAGGNPQIAKADGDAPVQAYIAAIPGWKHDVGRRLDALIAGAVPDVQKAVKWNSPFYGVEGQGWFLGIHVFTSYVKVAFFRGSWLKPLPPGASKTKDTRYVDIREGKLDEAQMADWVKQAASLPGWNP